VIALSTALLERKLAEDAKFAARFFRGVATLTAERLRKTTSDLRRSQWAAGSHPANANAAEGSGVLQRIKEFKAVAGEAEKRAAGNNGTVPDDNCAAGGEKFNALEREIRPIGDKTIAGWPRSCMPSCCRS